MLSPDCLYEFAGVSGGAPLQIYSLSAIDKHSSDSCQIKSRVGPTGFLQSDDDAKLKIDEFWYELWNSVKKIQCLLYKNKI